MTIDDAPTQILNPVPPRKKWHQRWSLRIPAGLALLALAGSIGAATSGSHPAPAAPAARTPVPAAPAAHTPANPVTILRQTGVPIPASMILGETDFDGNRYATAAFAGPPGSADDGVPGDRAPGEEVDVHTFASQAAEDSYLAVTPPQDGEARITLPLALVTVTSMLDLSTVGGYLPWGDPRLHGPTPQVIAARLNGLMLHQSGSGS
jgi:hypothetical protein